MNYQDYIRDYLNEELSESEKNDFEKAMSLDSELAGEVKLFRKMKIAYDLYHPGGVMDQLDQVWKEKQSQRTQRVYLIGSLTTLAAVFLLLFLIWQTNQSTNSTPDPEQLTFLEEESQQSDSSSQKNNSLNEEQNNPIPETQEENPENEATKSREMEEEKPMPESPEILNLIALEQKYSGHKSQIMENQILAFRGRSGESEKQSYLNVALDHIFRSTSIELKWKPFDKDSATLEMYSKVNSSLNKNYSFDQDHRSLTLTLPAGLYYWKLLDKDQEIIDIGRFYVHP